MNLRSFFTAAFLGVFALMPAETFIAPQAMAHPGMLNAHGCHKGHCHANYLVNSRGRKYAPGHFGHGGHGGHGKRHGHRRGHHRR